MTDHDCSGRGCHVCWSNPQSCVECGTAAGHSAGCPSGPFPVHAIRHFENVTFTGNFFSRGFDYTKVADFCTGPDEEEESND